MTKTTFRGFKVVIFKISQMRVKISKKWIRKTIHIQDFNIYVDTSKKKLSSATFLLLHLVLCFFMLLIRMDNKQKTQIINQRRSCTGGEIERAYRMRKKKQ